MVNMLCAYCIANTGVKLTCTNLTGNGKKSTVLSVMGNSTVRDNIADIYGINQLQSLLEIKSTPPEESVLAEYDLQPMTDDRTDLFSLSGLMSSCEHGRGRSSADRQFYFINKRPCDPQKMIRLVNEVYHMFNRHQYPVVVLDITLSKELVDVNVTPDKRQVFIQHEKLLLATVKTSLMKMFQSLTPILSSVGSTSSFSVGGLGFVKTKPQEPEGGCNTARGKLLSASKSKCSPVSSFLSNLKRSFTSAFDKSSQETVSSDNSSDHAAKQIKIDHVFGKNNESPIASKLTQIYDSRDGKESPAMNGSENLDLQLDEPSSYDSNSSRLCKRNILTEDHVTGDSLNKYVLDHEDVPTNSRDTTVQLLDLQNSRDHLSLSEKSDCELSDDGLQVKQPVTVNPKSDRRKDFVNEPEISFDEIKDTELVISSDVGLLMQKLVGDSAEEQLGSVDESFLSLESKPAAGAEVKRHPGSMKKSRKDTTKTLQKNTNFTVTELDAEQPVIKKVVMLNFSMEWLKKKKLESRQHDKKSSLASQVSERSFRAQISPSSNEAAENELKKELSKDMFEKMEVIGQFNLGFMIARLNRDLFIIDQHATDEKYNFEQLEKNTVLIGQRLIQPQRLELTVVNESILSENLEIFLKNGFEFTINEAGLSGDRILLKSIPTSKNWEFGKDDIEEMIFILSETPGVMCRPSRIRQMLASRACRSSVMIGTALTKPEMKKLIIHMGEIEQPWNCPHGRPTIRHLINLDMVSSSTSSSKLPQDFT